MTGSGPFFRGRRRAPPSVLSVPAPVPVLPRWQQRRQACIFIVTMTGLSEPSSSDRAPAQRLPEFTAAEFDALLNAAVDGIIVSDDAGRILQSNSAAEKLFGYRPGELTGKLVSTIMTEKDADSHERYMEHYLETGQKKIIGIGREVMARRKDGLVFPVALSVGEACVHNGRHFVALIRDLTEQKKAEEEALRHRELMNHASRLTTMGEMAAAMAHELNQPLSAISNYTAAGTRLLDQPWEEVQGDLQTALNEIGTQAHRAAQIIQRIRDFARSRAVTRESVSVRELIVEILPLARMDAKANHVDLRIRLEKELPSIVADPIQIQQVLLNLIRNGVDAMLELPDRKRRLDLLVSMEDDEHIRIEVRDRGHGVGNDARQQLFTPFFTTKESGMGMGLAISRSIISAHGGKLGYCNNPDAGATFFVVLPTRIEEQPI